MYLTGLILRVVLLAINLRLFTFAVNHFEVQGKPVYWSVLGRWEREEVVEDSFDLI